MHGGGEEGDSVIAEFWRDGCKYGEAEIKSVDYATCCIEFLEPVPFLVLPDDGILFDGKAMTGNLRGNQISPRGITRRP